MTGNPCRFTRTRHLVRTAVHGAAAQCGAHGNVRWHAANPAATPRQRCARVAPTPPHGHMWQSACRSPAAKPSSQSRGTALVFRVLPVIHGKRAICPERPCAALTRGAAPKAPGYSSRRCLGLTPRGLLTSASGPRSRYWRHQVLIEDSLGMPCLTMTSRTVMPFSRRSLTAESLSSKGYTRWRVPALRTAARPPTAYARAHWRAVASGMPSFEARARWPAPSDSAATA